MESFKKGSNKELFKKYLYIFIMIFLMNNLKAFGSGNKSYAFQNNQKETELEEIYKLYSIPYSEYDGLGGQFKTFFGLYSPKSLINNYPDLTIVNTSDAIREGYILKINDMTINQTNYKIKKEVLVEN